MYVYIYYIEPNGMYIYIYTYIHTYIINIYNTHIHYIYIWQYKFQQMKEDKVQLLKKETRVFFVAGRLKNGYN